MGSLNILPDLRMDNGSVNDCAGAFIVGNVELDTHLDGLLKGRLKVKLHNVVDRFRSFDLDQRRCYIDGTSHPIVALLISVETETVYISYLKIAVVDSFRQFDNATVLLGVLHAKVPAFFAAQTIGIRSFWSAVIIINRNKTGIFIFIGGRFSFAPGRRTR